MGLLQEPGEAFCNYLDAYPRAELRDSSWEPMGSGLMPWTAAPGADDSWATLTKLLLPARRWSQNRERRVGSVQVLAESLNPTEQIVADYIWILSNAARKERRLLGG